MNLDTIYAYLDEQTRDVPIGLIGVVVASVVIVAVVWVLRRLRSVAEMADPKFNPELDRTEAQLRAELDAEADRYLDDGTVYDWNNERRRGQM